MAFTVTANTSTWFSISVGGGLPDRTGTLSSTDADDILAASAYSAIEATLSSSDADDTLTASGDNATDATLSSVDADDALTASGDGAVSAWLASADNDDVLVAAADAAISATLSSTDEDDALSSSGDTRAAGALSSADEDDALDAYGEHTLPPITGTLSSVDEDDVVTAAVQNLIAAAMAAVDEDDTLLGSGYTPQEALPLQDISEGGWLPSVGDSLAGVLDDQSASDYAYTETLSAFEVKLDPMIDPLVHTDHRAEYQVAGDGIVSMIVSWKQGNSVIKSVTHSPAPAVLTTYVMELSEAEAAAITDYTDLRLRFEAA